MKRIFTTLAILLAFLSSHAQERPILSPYEDNYIISGWSPTEGNWDIKFQLSLKIYPFRVSDGWEVFFAYSQTATWDAYQVSSPFHDIIFRPGLYFKGNYGNDNVTLALEHQSNGRPYWGTPLRNPTTDIDDYSRGMNYLKVNWEHEFKESRDVRQRIRLTLKGGMGTGIGDYRRYNRQFSQDLYLRYLGYLTAEYEMDWRFLNVRAGVTPLWSASIANAYAEMSFRIKKNIPSPMIQWHYGYDEALANCYPDSSPKMQLRAGLKFFLK